MNKLGAIAACREFRPECNDAERTPPAHLGRATLCQLWYVYSTPRGERSTVVLGWGSTWEEALEDARLRADASATQAPEEGSPHE